MNFRVLEVVASLFLVVRPGAPSSLLFPVASPDRLSRLERVGRGCHRGAA